MAFNTLDSFGQLGDAPECNRRALTLSSDGRLVFATPPYEYLPGAGGAGFTKSEAWPDDEPYPLSKLVASGQTERFLVGPPFALPVGDVAMVYGDGGIGKSWLAHQLAVSVASGEDFLGASVSRDRVLVLDFENSRWELGRRLRATATAAGVDVDVLNGELCVQPFGQTGKTLLQLKAEVLRLTDTFGPALVIVDGWQSAFGGDVVSGEHVTNCYRLLKHLAGQDRAVLVLHHVSTTQMSNKEPNPAGNRFVRNFGRAVYHMRAEKTGNVVTLRAVKENYGISREPVTLHRRQVGDAVVFSQASNFTVPLPQNAETVRREELVLGFVRANSGAVLESRLFGHYATVMTKSKKTARRDLLPAI